MEFLYLIIASPLIKWTVICVLGLFAFYRYILSKCNYWESQGVPTASVSLYKRFRTANEKWEQELVQQKGNLFGIYELTNPVLFLSDPELIRDVLVKDFHIFPNRRQFNMGGDPIIENMLSIIRDDKWKRVRSIMSPTFSTGKLRKMRPLIEECLKTLAKNLENISESGKEAEMKRFFGAFSMEVVIQVAFGTKVNALIEESNPIIVNARKLFNRNVSPKVLIAVLLPKLAKYLKIAIFDTNVTKFFKEFTLQIIEQRKSSNNSQKRVDFLQLMLDAIENNESENLNEDKNDSKLDEKYSDESITKTVGKKTLTNEEFVAQCVLFFLAGYDTAATTISFAIYNLASKPETQQKLYEEAKTIFENNEEIDYDVVHTLKYLDAVVMESLRLFPAATFLERQANEDYILGSTGIKIRKGHIIHMPIYSIHRDPNNFDDPNCFKPERFFPENRKHHPYTHLPFGGGPRNCVGMRLALLEVKLALIHSVYRFKFSTTPNTKHPPECYLNFGIMVPKEIMIKVDKR